MFKKYRKAFSIVEVSVSIIIVGIVVVGIIGATRMVRNSKITTAQSLTQSSPVSSIKDLMLWYDVISPQSFSAAEARDGSAVTNWVSIAKTSQNAAITTATGSGSNRPTYIEGNFTNLPQLYFDGNDALTLPDGSFPISNSPFTIILNVTSAGEGTLLSSGSGANKTTIGFDSAGNLIVSGGSGNGGSYTVSTAGANINQTIIITYDGTTSTTSSNKVWVNGVSRTIDAISSGGSARITGSTSVTLGATSGGFQGNVSEIVVFGRAIDTDERKDIESYFVRKVGKVAPSNLRTGNGVITCTTAAPGVAYVPSTSQSVTPNSNPYACNTAAEYFGTPTYSCVTDGSTGVAVSGCYLGCSALGTAPSNGTYSVPAAATARSAAGTTVTLTCSSGYMVDTSSGGVASITCNSGSPNASWSGTLGTCVQRCTCANCTTDTTTVSGEVIHIFTDTASAKSLTCSTATTAKVLVVAGGGGGGGGSTQAAGNGDFAGPGGGAGGLVYNSAFSLTATTYSVTVGSGGLGGLRYDIGTSSNPNTGSNGGRSGGTGGNSVFSTITASGGGGGGGRNIAGKNGGSGGGGGATSSNTSGGTAVSGQGNAGGANSSSSCYGTGGGGGAGAVGANGSTTGGGNGGVGLSYDITGSSVTYAGGGASGGGNLSCTVTAQAGAGGGGSPASNATANTGGGGGGATATNNNAASGGSGIVIIRY